MIGTNIIARHARNADEAIHLQAAVNTATPGVSGWVERLVIVELTRMRQQEVQVQKAADEAAAEERRAQRAAKAAAKVSLLSEVTEGRDALSYLMGRRYHVSPQELAHVNHDADELASYMLAMQIESDPRAGYWDTHLDCRTEKVTPAERRQSLTFAWRGMTFRVRTDAPSSCPSGPCGNRVTLHRIA